MNPKLLLSWLVLFRVETFGFQPMLPAPTISLQRRVNRQFRSNHGRSTKNLLPHRKSSPSKYVLHSFNNFNTGGPFVNMNNNNEQPSTVMAKIQLLGTTVVRQFVTGYMGGYAMGIFWGILRGSPNLDRPMLWGMDFGFLQSIFSGSNIISQSFFSDKKEPKTVMLWSTVVRNTILAVYFGRTGGLAKMIRSAVIYGGLTYYFVSKKNKRDSDPNNPAVLFQNMMMNNQNGFSSSGQAVNMQELLQQLAKQQQQPSSPPSPIASKNPKKRPSPLDDKDIVDVEWERDVDETDGE
mmetsp:Transcript_13693/g.18342  ORF Transcript_13693/g.18342 Transcript_13693/m.18342 type:complete len:294 (+) Transcript_13693:116-997(+)